VEVEEGEREWEICKKGRRAAAEEIILFVIFLNL
jgi:hypothetical protein